MKKKILFTLLPLLALPLTSCGTSIGVYADADKYLAGNQTYTESVNTIEIDWVSGELTLIEDDTIEGVKIEEEANTTEEKALVHSYLNEGNLKIKYFASGYMSTQYNLKKSLTVTYKPGLTKMDVDITSGKLHAENITATEFELDMTSGDADIGSVIADDIDIDATSGDIEITKVTAKDFDSDLTSGTITIGFTAIDKATFDLTSGTINMKLPEDGGTVKVSKTSGSVNTKRECSVNNNTYKFGSGAADIKVSMTSGKLNIE